MSIHTDRRADGRGVYASCSDDELIAAYLGGRASAFDELLKRNQAKLFSYIMFVVRDRATAEDIFQDTFLKIIARIHEGRYVADGKFTAWAVRIAHNEIMNLYRDSSYMKTVDSCAPSEMMQIAAETEQRSVESKFVNEQVYSDVRRLMDRLPAAQREVVYMRYYQQLSFKEIAGITGVSINTSLGRMRYALLNMRRMARAGNISLQLMP